MIKTRLEAIDYLCPETGNKCVSDDCMAWKFLGTLETETTTRDEVGRSTKKKAKEILDKKGYKIKHPEGIGWEHKRSYIGEGYGQSKYIVSVFNRCKEDAKSNAKGYCGKYYSEDQIKQSQHRLYYKGE